MTVPARPTSGAPIDSAWGGVAHDAAVAQDIQAGTFGVPTSPSTVATATLTFPRPFASPPAVVLTAYTGGGTQTAFCHAPTAAGVVIGVVPNSGGNLPAGTTTVAWVAIGPRA